MRPLLFCAGDTIAHSGDMGQEMFFLERGKVIVVSSDTQSTVFATLEEGSYFGETSVSSWCDYSTVPTPISEYLSFLFAALFQAATCNGCQCSDLLRCIGVAKEGFVF